VAVMEDQEPPVVVVAVSRKNKDDKEELVAWKFKAVLGVRYPPNIEIVRLEALPSEDTDAKNTPQPPPVDEAQFIIEGEHGLENGDPVVVQKDEEEK